MANGDLGGTAGSCLGGRAGVGTHAPGPSGHPLYLRGGVADAAEGGVADAADGGIADAAEAAALRVGAEGVAPYYNIRLAGGGFAGVLVVAVFVAAVGAVAEAGGVELVFFFVFVVGGFAFLVPPHIHPLR